jgi:hypothetical protein
VLHGITAAAIAFIHVVTPPTLPMEETVIELSPGTQTVTMRFSSSAPTAGAWVIPVPARAEITLGDASIFEELDKVGEPEYEIYHEVGFGKDDIMSFRTVGPYEITQLDSPASFTNWSRQNNIRQPADAVDYFAEGWSMIAVRRTGDRTNGPPLRLSFATTTPVYPMRLAKSGVGAWLRLHVLAEHRMDISGTSHELLFAGRAEARNKFLTTYRAVPNPQTASSDIKFTRAARDDDFRAVVARRQYIELPWWLLAVAVATVLGAVFLVVRRVRRR